MLLTVTRGLQRWLARLLPLLLCSAAGLAAEVPAAEAENDNRGRSPGRRMILRQCLIPHPGTPGPAGSSAGLYARNPAGRTAVQPHLRALRANAILRRDGDMSLQTPLSLGIHRRRAVKTRWCVARILC